MVDKVPKDITAGTANRGSTVHASDADIVGILSRGHLEEDISRIQAAVHLFDTGVAYLADDIVLATGTFSRANKATGPGAFVPADWDSILADQQTRTLVTLTANQVVSASTDTDITNLTFTMPTVTGKFALVIFNINWFPSQNDKDVVFRVSDGGSIQFSVAAQAGQSSDYAGIRWTYVAAMNGQIVKAVIAKGGGNDESATITIIGATDPASTMQVLELGG